MKPYLLGRDEGPAIWMFDSFDTIKADTDQTGGSFALFEFLDFKGSTVPLHIHVRCSFRSSGKYGITVLGPPPET